MFQSTRPHGARHNATRVSSPNNPFQSTRPHGARPALNAARTTLWSFNPRAHTGRDGQKSTKKGREIGFNPRAHTGRDSDWLRGFTTCQSFNPRAHTGRDHGIRPTNQVEGTFQSTRPHGARLAWRCCKTENILVSIHAPTRGATVQVQPVRISAFYATHSAKRT